MDIDEVKIRLAEAQDIERLTDLHCESFKPDDHVPMMLGRNYVKATYRWLVRDKNSYALVADCGGKIVGLVAICDRAFTFPMFVACLPEFVLSLWTHPSLILRMKLWKRLFRRPVVNSKRAEKIANYPAVAQLTIVAVDPLFRGRNIFSLLIAAAKDYSQKRGTRSIRVGVYYTNAPSRRAFVKDGWIEVPDLETHETVFFMAFLDEAIGHELGIEAMMGS